jgi:hypothetical protein
MMIMSENQPQKHQSAIKGRERGNDIVMNEK